jgi:hypothetical protein
MSRDSWWRTPCSKNASVGTELTPPSRGELHAQVVRCEALLSARTRRFWVTCTRSSCWIARMRTSQEVARRCLCLELVSQRVAIEHQAPDLGDDAASLHEGLMTTVSELGLEASFHGTELEHLRATIGALDMDDPTLDVALADLAILLWCLGRIEQLPTVEQLMSDALDEVLAAGFLARAEGDLEAVAVALGEAKLRPTAELEPVLMDVAKANAISISTHGEASRDIPSGTVFYIIPWLRSTDWPWGQAAALVTDALGGMTFSPDGMKLVNGPR